MNNKAFHIQTFGCQMNVRESQWLSGKLLERGFKEAAVEDADVILLHTCSVREKPEQKVRSAIRDISQKTSKQVLVGILGCVAQQLGENLYAEDARVRLVAGGDNIINVPDAVEKLLENPRERLSFLKFLRQYPEKDLDALTTTGPKAYVNIMQGCDNFCAYCIVPYTRGRQKSRREAPILAECETRLAQGAKELVLLGQNVNAWGKDLGLESGFADLLGKIALLPGLERLRFVSPHPRDMDRKTVKAFGEFSCLCPKIHLPLQAGSDRILKNMRRGYTSGDFLRLIREIRAIREDMAFSTDLIVGFPGETETDFQDTLRVVEESGFMASFSFCYSDRPGTRASLMDDKIAPEIKHERLLRLQSLQEKLGRSWLQKRVGQRAMVMAEGPSPRKSDKPSWQFRDVFDVPVNVEIDADPERMIEVEIIQAKRNSLIGRMVK